MPTDNPQEGDDLIYWTPRTGEIPNESEDRTSAEEETQPFSMPLTPPKDDEAFILVNGKRFPILPSRNPIIDDQADVMHFAFDPRFDPAFASSRHIIPTQRWTIKGQTDGPIDADALAPYFAGVFGASAFQRDETNEDGVAQYSGSFRVANGGAIQSSYPPPLDSRVIFTYHGVPYPPVEDADAALPWYRRAWNTLRAALGL